MDHKRPLIGLTPSHDAEKNRVWLRPEYARAILGAGAVPVLLLQYPGMSDIAATAARLDGVLFTGGDDVHPKYYGEAVDPKCGEISEERDIFELGLYGEAVKLGLPIFGICRGIQLINVAAGGTLYQHIEGHARGVAHTVTLDRNSLFYDILGKEEIVTNSYHHQAVKAPAPSMVAAGESGGVIEAIYDPDAAFNASVQWHPENMYKDDENSRKLFAAFVSACTAYMKRNAG